MASLFEGQSGSAAGGSREALSMEELRFAESPNTDLPRLLVIFTEGGRGKHPLRRSMQVGAPCADTYCLPGHERSAIVKLLIARGLKFGYVAPKVL